VGCKCWERQGQEAVGGDGGTKGRGRGTGAAERESTKGENIVDGGAGCAFEES